MQIIRTQSAQIVRQSPSQHVIICQGKRVFPFHPACSLKNCIFIQYCFYQQLAPEIIIIIIVMHLYDIV